MDTRPSTLPQGTCGQLSNGVTTQLYGGVLGNRNIHERTPPSPSPPWSLAPLYLYTLSASTITYLDRTFAGVGVGQARNADHLCSSNKSSHCINSRTPV